MPLWRRSASPRTKDAGTAAEGERPEATYARVLDGTHLWLEVVSPVDGTLAVVGPDGSVVGIDGAQALRAASTTAMVLDLSRLLPGDEVELPVLCVGPDRTSRPVHLSDDNDDVRTRTPATPDGRFRFTAGSNDAGDLQLRRSTLPPGVPVQSVGLAGNGLEVRWRVPSGPPGRLVVRAGNGDLLAELDTVPEPGEGYATLRAEDLPAHDFSASLWLDDDAEFAGTGARPLRRARDDLARPHGSVLMPEIRVRDGGQEHVLRLTWSDDGALGVEHTSRDVAAA